MSGAALSGELAARRSERESRAAETVPQIELELELIQSHMTQKPVLRGEVGARALRNPEGRGKGRKVVHTSEHVAAWWDARACMCYRDSGAP